MTRLKQRFQDADQDNIRTESGRIRQCSGRQKLRVLWVEQKFRTESGQNQDRIRTKPDERFWSSENAVFCVSVFVFSQV